MVWVTFDTPVDDDDIADVAYVERQVEATFPYLADGTVVICSSASGWNHREAGAGLGPAAGGRTASFACSPENLRLGKAIDVFTNPDRVVVGCAMTRLARVGPAPADHGSHRVDVG